MTSERNMLQNVGLIPLLWFVTTYVILSALPVVCGMFDNQLINCTIGCDVLSNTRSIGLPRWLFTEPTTTISTRFKCPSECLCTLGNHDLTLTCPNGSSSVQVLYPPNIVDLSWNNTGLHGIEPDAFADLKKGLAKLDISNNMIITLHLQQFRGFTKLAYLDLSSNNIAQLQPQQFDGLSKLWSLYLSNNNIVELNAQQFQGLIRLRILEVANNNIAELHPTQFEGLTNLVNLHMNNNEIVELHAQQFEGLINLAWLHMSNNDIEALHPQQFKGLVSLRQLYMFDNSIVELHHRQFEGLLNLRQLYMRMNDIIELHPEQLSGLTKLGRFDMCKNNIMELHPRQFERLNNLWDVCLSGNDIVELFPQQFEGLIKLERLSLSTNSIVVLHPQQFHGLVKLEKLYLDHNNIMALHPQQFEGLTKLRQLYLSHNQIKVIYSYAFQSLDRLRILDLGDNDLSQLPSLVKNQKIVYLSAANNQLSHFTHGIFQFMNGLRYLDVSGNELNGFETELYFVNNSMESLDVVDMRQNILQVVNYNSFRGLINKTQILVDNAATCCFVEPANCTATLPRSQFLTCGRLLANQIQRVVMWILGIFAVICNISVLCYRFSRRQQRNNKVQLLLISNLSLSDLVMGIYMLMIASADVHYRNYFPSEAWRSSITCKVAGTLSILSSEASVFFVTLISIDRFMGIRYTYSNARLATRSARVVVVLLWVFAIALSITSSILSGINPAYYDVSEVCTGLPLSKSNTFQTGYWEYNLGIKDSEGNDIIFNNTREIIDGTKPGIYFGIAIFTTINFISIWIILLCYIGIFITVRHTTKQSGRNQNQKEELRMAIKMGLIVFTDMLCWLPIIILSILVQSGRHTVTPVVYTWIVTFVLPINSAINPFLYTLATVLFECIHRKNNHSRSSSVHQVVLKLTPCEDTGKKILLEEQADLSL